MTLRTSLACVVVTLLGVCACERSDARNQLDTQVESRGLKASREVRAPEPLDLALDGCEGLFGARGPKRPARCLVAENKAPALWLAGVHDADPLELRLDGAPVIPAGRESNTLGTMLELDSSTRGRLSVTRPGGRPLVFDIHELSPTYAALASLASLARGLKGLGASASPSEGELLKHAAILPEGKAILGEEERFLLECRKLGPLLYPKTHQAQAAISHFEHRADALGEHVCISTLLSRALYVSIDPNPDSGLKSNFRAASEYIARLRRFRFDLDSRLRARYWRAVLDRRLGLLHNALFTQTRLVELASAVANKNFEASALNELAHLLVRLGRHAEAGKRAEQATKAARRAGNPKRALSIGVNANWIDILRSEHDPRLPYPTAESRELVAKAARLAEQTPGVLETLAIAQLNLAVALAGSGNLEEAEVQLEDVDLDHLDLRQRLYYELTWARLELGRGQVLVARKRLENAESFSELARDPEFTLELIYARAALEIGADRDQAALLAFQRGDALADDLARKIPIDQGRSYFSAVLTRSRSRHLALLSRLGNEREALCVILAARGRHARSLLAIPEELGDDPRYLEAVDRYHQAANRVSHQLESKTGATMAELQVLASEQAEAQAETHAALSEAVALLDVSVDAPPWSCPDALSDASDELLLAMYPSVDRRGWWFGAQRADRFALFEVAGEPETAIAGALGVLKVEGLAEDLRSLRIVPTGEFAAIDVHALRLFQGSDPPTVSYSIALGKVPGADTQIDMTAAIIAGQDPASGYLEQVEAEAAEVRSLLKRRGWSVSTSWMGERPSPTLLHYAGHGHKSGLAGWDSSISLGPGRQLSSRELIVERRAPPAQVVLGACQAGASDLKAIDGGMNMAFAFLLVGAELVIAPSEDVDDELAHEFARALYDELPASGPPKMRAWAEALASAQRDEPRYRSWRLWRP